MTGELSNTAPAPLAVPSAYDNYSLPLLQTEISLTQLRIAELQKNLDAISTEIGRRFATPLLEQMKANSAQSVTIEVGDDGFRFKGSVSKTVSWDSDALQKLAAKMDWVRAQHFFKIKFSVAEAMFKSIEPGEFKNELTAARTTKCGRLKIEMIAPKHDEA